VTVATYRVCKTFTVESGHMLSKHPERCKYPHGHTRTVEVVVAGDSLDENGMLVDFKALRLALQDHIERYDHAMAVNSNDPMLPALRELYPEDAVVVFEDTDPTTEVIAKEIFDFVDRILSNGFRQDLYSIPAGKIRLQRVRVWETPSSWAEYGV
jgi:6-pyruvoyltetrahydropterin/6-carboxytetrahydropterin synthase